MAGQLTGPLKVTAEIFDCRQTSGPPESLTFFVFFYRHFWTVVLSWVQSGQTNGVHEKGLELIHV